MNYSSRAGSLSGNDLHTALYFLLLTQRQLEESIKCTLLEDGDTANLKEKILYLYSVTIEANRILGIFD
jgi:hypothetical protein